MDGKQVKTIPLRWLHEKGFRTVEALAWDGTVLWTAIAAGFSSTFNQVDADTGRIIRSVFADCNPAGGPASRMGFTSPTVHMCWSSWSAGSVILFEE
jgi:hypothetical protein